MSDPQNALLAIKNQWLHQQIEVEFPTKESLEGRALYLEKADNTPLEMWHSRGQEIMESDALFLVDFHRLTIMFAQLQAQRWHDADQQSLVVEFLTQIIYSPPCELYLAFENGQPTAAAIVTRQDAQTLISDIVALKATQRDEFISGLVNKLQLLDGGGDIFVEQMTS